MLIIICPKKAVKELISFLINFYLLSFIKYKFNLDERQATSNVNIMRKKLKKKYFRLLYFRLVIERELEDLKRATLVHTAEENLRVAVSEREVDNATFERLEQDLLVEFAIEHAHLAVRVESNRVGKVLVALVHRD